MDWIVYLFVVLVLIYLYCHRKIMVRSEQALFAIALVMLVATNAYQKRMLTESFTDNELSYDLVNTEEDYSSLIGRMTVYLTLFTKASFPQIGNKWVNVAYDPKKPECIYSSAQYFTFEDPPIFSIRSGVSFGTNRLYGPYSNELGISLQSTFTIFMCVKHGQFSTDASKEVELLKLYANSNNNNALALYIRRNSVQIENNVQKAELLFRFTDSEDAVPCVLNSSDSAFVFDRLNPSFFFIIKEVDRIRIAYMIGGSSVIRTIAQLNIKETSATFSNKELVINRFQNWKGSMYSFGILNEAIPDNEIANIYNHVYSEYLKATNDDYLGLVNNYNSILENLRKFQQCPFDKTVCEACTTVTKWNDPTQIVSAPTECKAAINSYCSANSKHPMCKCWDPNSVDYKTQSCIMYRQIFDPNAKITSVIKQDELNELKQQFGLISAAECPKPTAKDVLDASKGGESSASCSGPEGLLKNVYQDYELDKLQVKINNKGTTSNPYKVEKVYDKDSAVQSEIDPKANPYARTTVPIDPSISRRTVANPYSNLSSSQRITSTVVEAPKETTEKRVEPPSKEEVADDIPEEIRKYVLSSNKVSNPYPSTVKSLQVPPSKGEPVVEKVPIKSSIVNPYKTEDKGKKPMNDFLSMFLPGQ